MNNLLTNASSKTRLIGLDILRAIAVVLVLFNHSGSDGPLARFGWLGVDLFFVLSGFLVSSLLFQEYKASGAIRAKRFFIRRSLKILPPFYVFVTISLFYGAFLKGHDYTLQSIFSEIFFVQNYLPSIWRHTWSLGVEEQFYLSLIILLVIAHKLKVLDRPRVFLTAFLSILILSLVLKFRTTYLHRETYEFFFVETHLRIEGVLFGVLLSYLYHFTSWLNRFTAHWRYLMIFGVLLISPGFFIHGGSYFMNSIGLTMANVGFALILLAILSVENRKKEGGKTTSGIVIKAVSMIGIHSYSIYLWHLNAKELVKNFLAFDPVLSPALYIISGILVGIAMSIIVERPILNWRNKHWR